MDVTLSDKLVALHVKNERRISSRLTQAEQKELSRLLAKLLKRLAVGGVLLNRRARKTLQHG